jgi:hypothetical protein
MASPVLENEDEDERKKEVENFKDKPGALDTGRDSYLAKKIFI